MKSRLRRALSVAGLLSIGATLGCSDSESLAPSLSSGGTSGASGAAGSAAGAGGAAGLGGAGGAAGTGGTGGAAGTGGTGGAAGTGGAGGAAGAEAVTIQLLAINDFHGHLEPPTGKNGLIVAPATDPIAQLPGATLDPGGATASVPAGGAAYLATHIAELRAQNPSTIVVSAGDLTGASPLISGLFHDEPTILVMNALGLDYNGVGNHEFDHGLAELLRLQNGGCAPGGCTGMPAFAGASFKYLAANVEQMSTSTTIFPAYDIRAFGGVKIALIGMTLKSTPAVTVSTSVEGLAFESEAQTVNALVPELKEMGANAIVVLLHQGGAQGDGGTYDSCTGLGLGGLGSILKALDPAVDVVVSAHSHAAYNCVIGGRIVTSAASYGRLLTRIDLTFAPDGTLIDKKAKNVANTQDVAKDPAVQSIIATYEAQAAQVANKIVGYIASDITRSASPSCETPLGDLIADAMLAATSGPSTGGAIAAFMNAGGLRADLLAAGPDKPAGAVTYAEAFAVQPFSNLLVTMDLSGSDILAALSTPAGHKLQVAGVSYSYDIFQSPSVDASSVILGGKPLDVGATYRVTTNNFVAGGGDGFSAFKNGTNVTTQGIDVDALVAYLGSVSSVSSPLAPPATDRVTGNGCQ